MAARARELAPDHVVEIVAVVEPGQAIPDSHLLDLGIRLDQALHLRLELGLARLEEQDDDPHAHRHLQEHLDEVGIAVIRRHQGGIRVFQVTDPHGQALGSPQEKGRRENRPPSGRARGQREGQRRDEIRGRAQKRRRRVRNRHRREPPRPSQNRQSPEQLHRPRHRLLAAEPPHPAHEEEDVAQKGDLQDGKRDLPPRFGLGDRQHGDRCQEESPRGDPVQECGPAELLVQEQEDDEEKDRPGRLNQQREEIRIHRMYFL